jgi:hypothetical protein
MYNTYMGVRKIKKSYISSTGYFKSFKNNKQIAYESILERDFYMTLEFDDEVLSYEEQPLRINYEYKDGISYRYTPDCLVTYYDNTQKYFEVKYANNIRDDIELKEKLDFLIAYFSEQINIELEIVTDEDIDSIYLDNLNFLYNFAYLQEDEEKYSHIENTLENLNDDITVEQLLLQLGNNKMEQLQYLPYVWNYLFINTYLIDLDEKITNKVVIKTGSDTWEK